MVGDGSYLMMAQEIVTAVSEGIKLIVVLVQNHGFASIGALSEPSARSASAPRTATATRRPGRSTAASLPVDLAANAASLGADVLRGRHDRRARGRAAQGARPPSGPTVVHVETDPLAPAPVLASPGGTCPVAEVAALDSTQRRPRGVRGRRSADSGPTCRLARPNIRIAKDSKASAPWQRPSSTGSAASATAGSVHPERRRSTTRRPARSRPRCCSAEPPTSTPRSRRPRRRSRRGARPRSASAPRSCSRSASWSTPARRRAGRDRLRRARQGARRRSRRGAARPRGRRVRLRHPAAAQGRVLRPGLRPGSTSTRSASRSACVAGITPFNFPAMVPMWMYPVAIACGNTFVLKPSERDPSASNCIAELWRRGRAARRRLQRRARRQGRGRRAARPPRRRRGLVRRLDPDRPVHPRAGQRATASGSRPSAAPRTTRSSCPTPTSTSPPTTSSAAAFGSAGERCMAISAAVAVGDAADALVDDWCPKAAGGQGRPGPRPAERDGPGRHRGRPGPDRRPDRHRRGRRAPTLRRRRPRARVAGHEDGFFVGPTVIDQVTTDDGRLHRGDLRAGAVGRARRRRRRGDRR